MTEKTLSLTLFFSLTPFLLSFMTQSEPGQVLSLVDEPQPSSPPVAHVEEQAPVEFPNIRVEPAWDTDLILRDVEKLQKRLHWSKKPSAMPPMITPSYDSFKFRMPETLTRLSEPPPPKNKPSTMINSDNTTSTSIPTSTPPLPLSSSSPSSTT